MTDDPDKAVERTTPITLGDLRTLLDQLAAANKRIAELEGEAAIYRQINIEGAHQVDDLLLKVGSLEAPLAAQSRALEEMGEIARAAAELVRVGLRNNGEHLIVVELRDKSDPHYRLCGLLDRAGLIPPSPATIRRRAARASAEGGE